MKRLLFLFLLFLSAGFFSGCATTRYNASSIGVLPTDTVIDTITEDIVAFISEHYPPGHTSFRIIATRDEEQENNDFIFSLDNTLRQKGFAVSHEASLGLTYAFDSLLEDFWYAQLRFTDNFIFSSLYTQTGQFLSRSQLNKGGSNER